MEPAVDDFYQRLRNRTQRWVVERGPRYRYAEALLVAPDLFHLLSRLLLDARVPSAEKLRVAAAIAYFLMPADSVPELVLGPGGYIDDVALAAGVIGSLVRTGQGELAKELWAGRKDLLQVVQNLLTLAETGLLGRAARGLRRLGRLRIV